MLLNDMLGQHRGEGNKCDDTRPSDASIAEHFFGDLIVNIFDVVQSLQVDRGGRGELKIEVGLLRTISTFTVTSNLADDQE